MHNNSYTLNQIILVVTSKKQFIVQYLYAGLIIVITIIISQGTLNFHCMSTEIRLLKILGPDMIILTQSKSTKYHLRRAVLKL